jgi:hypothetical protein
MWNNKATQCYAFRFDVRSSICLERLHFVPSSAARYFTFGRIGVCARASCMLAMFEQFLQWEGEMVMISSMYCNSG